MAEYTIELRTIIENGHNIFDFPYQFYDEEQRLKFQDHFIRHFYFREIGCDTIDRFKWYLQDKFNLIMPYYNELFETALIEYDKKFNYDVTETHETTRDTKGTSKQEKYSVGQFSGENESELEGNKNLSGSQNNISDTTNKLNETNSSSNTTSETVDNEKSETIDNETTGTETGTNKTTENASSKNINKYLDTPQGKIDLDTTDYLTNLTQDEKETTSNVDGENSKNSSGTNKTASSGTDKTSSTGTSENTSTINNQSESNNTFNGSHEEESSEKFNSKTTDKQKTSFDDNTRNETDENQIEKTTRRMYGNIGVQTASDIITKHVELQQILKKIELMLFDECEDLFLLVY